MSHIKTIFTQKNLFWFCIIAVLSVGILLRSYRLFDLTYFEIDQGMDLLMADKILSNHELPLVGPYLTLNDFYTPPTYYYLLAFFLWTAGGSIEKTIIWFVVLSVISIILITLLGLFLENKSYGIICGILYACSNQMIIHGRTMWQPYPIQSFLLAGLIMLHLSQKKGNTFYLISGVILFFIALSIYPSPVLLLPWLLATIFHHYRPLKFLKALIYTVLTLLSGMIIYIPQFIFEFHYNFPTIKSIFSPTDSLSRFVLPRNFVDIFFIYFRNIGVLIEDVLNVRYYPLFITLPFCILFVLLLVVFIVAIIALKRKRDEDTEKILSFIKLKYLVLGFIPIGLFNSIYEPHRLVAYYPFIILILSFFIYKFFLSKNRIFRILTIIMLILYFLGNLTTAMNLLLTPPEVSTNQLNKRREVVSIIFDDISQKKLTFPDFKILMYKNDDPNFILNILYLLQQKVDYPVSFNYAGNKLNFSELIQMSYQTQYIYLICLDYEEQENKCIQNIERIKSNIHREKEWHKSNLSLYVYKT